ncbi:MAG: macro domain-containing protein [Pseudomonadota bacterium]
MAIESYEVITNNDIQFALWMYPAAALFLAIVMWALDGMVLDGHLRGRARVTAFSPDGHVEVSFGDIFANDGWIAIGVNDFFDSQVDERVISANTLHGQVIRQFWPNANDKWDEQVAQELAGTVAATEHREQGKSERYPIGTAAALAAPNGERKFIFVALGRTAAGDGVTQAAAEDVINAARGLLGKARAVCADEPLNIPLLGGGLARTGIREQLLLQLVLIGIMEETRVARITSKIRIVLPPSLASKINLGAINTHWE